MVLSHFTLPRAIGQGQPESALAGCPCCSWFWICYTYIPIINAKSTVLQKKSNSVTLELYLQQLDTVL